MKRQPFQIGDTVKCVSHKDFIKTTSDLSELKRHRLPSKWLRRDRIRIGSERVIDYIFDVDRWNDGWICFSDATFGHDPRNFVLVRRGKK